MTSPAKNLDAAAVREPPSGAQIELSYGDQRAFVVELGGAIRRYEVAGRDRLDGYGSEELGGGARGQTFVPWSNRLRDGRYEFGGNVHQVALSEPAKGNAIHGLVRWVNWAAGARTPEGVTMTYVLHPQDGWPFTLGLSIAYRLAAGGLSVATTATNLGSSPAPYGTGAHPYLRLDTPTIDGLQLLAPATSWMPTDERGIPSGLRPVEGTPYDFRSRRQIDGVRLDTGYGDLARGEDGLARVELSDASTGVATILWMDGAYSYFMLFSGDTLPDPRRRRTGLGVEPMTCAPNALQSGQGLAILEPGESHVARWGIVAVSGP